MTIKKTQAYCATEFTTAVKSYMIQDPGVESYKKITAVICS